MEPMLSFDPKLYHDPWETRPPEKRAVLVYDALMKEWWRGQYFPDEDNPAYQPEAWLLTGMDDYKPQVTHWMFMPPGPQ